ncbi:MAG: FkbM family methyltransferase [Ruminococcus sp.]|nr:FkbM family methyltransferase [Ruminococcus sp.]
MKIAIYGTGEYAHRLLNCLKSDTEIVYFVESNPSEKYCEGKKILRADEINTDDFQYLVIAVAAHDEIVSHLNSVFDDYNNTVGKKVINFSDFICNVLNYFECEIVSTTEGLQYICEKNDLAMRKAMLETGKTFSYDQIKKFFELTDRHYGKRKRNGIFLDIGANIGTTSIYVKKLINPDLRIIGFEPCKRIWKLFRANCILNDAEDIQAMNYGVGSKNGTEQFFFSIVNPGGSGLKREIDLPDREYIEDVDIIALDYYLETNNITADEIDYIWLDVEGFESEVIKGAMKTLTSKKIPFIQEFNPLDYTDWETYEENIKSVYDNFIVVDECGIDNKDTDIIYSTSQLKEYADKLLEFQSIKKAQVWADLFFF